MGSSIRVKIDGRAHKSQPSNYCGSVTSGSEGDVDSGHGTESVYQKEISSSSPNSLNPLTFPYFKYNFKNQLSCCAMHAAILKKDLLKWRNRIFTKYMNSEFISEKLKIFEKKTSVSFSTNSKREEISSEVGKEAFTDNEGK